MQVINSECMMKITFVYFYKDVDGDTLINGEKYKIIMHNEQLLPVYSNGKLPNFTFPVPIIPVAKSKEEDLTALEINYQKPCIKLTNKCLHELNASCPFCVEDEMQDEAMNKIQREYFQTRYHDEISQDENEPLPKLTTNDAKRKRGRPRKSEEDKRRRKTSTQVEYLKRRYRDDPEFKTKCLQNGKIYYQLKKEQNEIKNILSKKEIKSLYNRKYRDKQKNNQE